MTLPLVIALFISSPKPVPNACGQAFEAVKQLAHREADFGYAREVAVEGRRAFVSACSRHLTGRQVRCIVDAQTSDQLYACTP